MGVIVNACARRRWIVRAFGANTCGAYGTGTPPCEGSGDRHHAITDLDEMISHASDNWDIDLPSEEMKVEVNRKCHISLFHLDSEHSLDC